MRIALIDPSLFTLPYDRRLAAGLLEIGHDVTLHGRMLRPDDGTSEGIGVAGDFYRIAGSARVAALPGPLRLGIKGLDHALSMRKLLIRLRREQPDVIHFQWLPLPLLDGVLLGRFRAIAPLVLTVHDTNPFNGDPSAGLQARGFRRCLAAFDQLVVHTAQGEARLRGLGLPAEKIVVRPHGMLSDPAPGPADAMPGVLTFMLFGKIKPYKGPDLLIKAFAAIPETLRQQARLRIVGKPYMDLGPLHALAASHGVPLTIEPGFVADGDVPSLYGPATVAMFPYREIEASGVMFLALAHGRPIIASSLGSFAELLTDGQHGHLVPPDNVPALTAGMSHMIADRPFAARCAAAVQNLATSIPDWTEIARRTVQTYRAADAVRATAIRGLAMADAAGS